MVLRALRYYQTILNGLLNNEGERFEGIVNPFGNYLTETAKQAVDAAKGLNQNRNDVVNVVKEKEYMFIVRQSLAFYIADLERKRDIIDKELRQEGKPLLYRYDDEIGNAKIMKQTIDEKVEGVSVNEDEPIFYGEDNNSDTDNRQKK